MERVVLKKKKEKSGAYLNAHAAILFYQQIFFLFLHIFCFLEMHMLITLVLSI